MLSRVSDKFSSKLMALHEWIDNVVCPMEKDVDRNRCISEAQWQSLRAGAINLGLCGYNVPKKYDGPGLSLLEQAMVAEELGRTSQALAEALYYVPESVLMGNDTQLSRWMPELISGNKTITIALTEQECGSSLNEVATTAIKIADGWKLNGKKKFITRGNNADYVIVLARTGSSGKASTDLSAFMVEHGAPGFTHKELEAMGWWGESLAELEFNECRVPSGALIGSEGDGLRVLLRGVTGTRLRVAGKCVGVLQDVLQLSIEHCKKRIVGGKTLGSRDNVRAILADMNTELHAARLLLYAAADIGDSAQNGFADLSYRDAVARAKIYATEAASRAVDQALQLHGALGYTSESKLERLYRDVRGYRIGEGTSEVLRADIAKHLLR